MKGSKIIQYLRTLDRDEWQRFDRFVRSPYFNTHADTLRLWEALQKRSGDLHDEAVAKKAVFKDAFPKQKFDERKLYNLSKYLLRLLTEFLIYERRKEELFEREVLTQIGVLTEKNLGRYIPRLIKQAQEQAEELRVQDLDGALLEYQFAFTQMNYALSQDNRSLSIGIEEVSQKLDQFFVIEKLKLAVPIANRNFILNQSSGLDFIKEALSMYQRYQWTDYPLLRALYLALEMFWHTESDEAFIAFANYLHQFGKSIPNDGIQALYTYALNFCSIQSKRGKTNYLDHMFLLYQEMIQQGLLLVSPSTAPPNFKNAVTLAIKLKKYQWTEDFIRQNSEKLPESHRDIIVHYSMATLAFVQEEFSIAQKHLLEVEFLDPFYRLSADILLLKIYYEIEEVESLYFRIQALRKYLQRDKTLAEQNRKAYINFVRILHKMARLRFDHNSSLERLENMIAHTSPLVEMQWLTEKLELLKVPA